MFWIDVGLRVAIGYALLVLAYQLGRRVERRGWMRITRQLQFDLALWRLLGVCEGVKAKFGARSPAPSNPHTSPHVDGLKERVINKLAYDCGLIPYLPTDIEQPDVVCAQCAASYRPILSECPQCKVKCRACRAALFGPGRVIKLEPGRMYLQKPCPECGELRYQVDDFDPGFEIIS